MIEYISSSSLSAWEKDPENFYLERIVRIPKRGQTMPMAVGSAFDVYIKAFLCKKFGIEFDFKTEFFRSVERPEKKLIQKYGRYVFECYIISGLKGLLERELDGAFDITMESRVRKDITYNGVTVPLLGIPDLTFKKHWGVSVQGGHLGVISSIYDWKVNSFFGKASPQAGYLLCKDGWKSGRRASPTNGRMHKSAQPLLHGNFEYNAAGIMNAEWAKQLSMYAWLGGAPVGDKIMAGIEQCVAKQKTEKEIRETGNEMPWLRFAKFRNVITSDFQLQLWDRIVKMWSHISQDWFFPDLSLEESQKKQAQLMESGQGYQKDWVRKVLGRE
jgi:hypothetical protein